MPGRRRRSAEGGRDLVLAYLTGRETLVLNLLLVDARRDPLANDLKALALLSSSGRPVAVVATKMDKLKSSLAAARGYGSFRRHSAATARSR